MRNPGSLVFKIVYRRYTAFSIESIEQTFNGSADFGKKVTCTISRNGDLIHRTYLQVQIPDVSLPVSAAPSAGGVAGFRWLNWLGHILVKTVELEIGGQRIDKHYSTWLHIWNELTQTAGHAVGYATMVGNTPDLTAVAQVASTATSATVVKGKTLYIPLQFWFCNNPGLALPLIALQYHEVKINIEFAPASDCFWSGTKTTAGSWVTTTSMVVPALPYASLYVDYIYLDTEERRRFSQVSHEYLISQLQHTGPETANSANKKVQLNFNHPVKELVWAVQTDAAVNGLTCPFGKQWFNFTDAVYGDATAQAGDSWAFLLAGAAGGASGVRSSILMDSGANPVVNAKLQLNGHDRFSQREGSYFNLIQPYQHHTNIPSKGINVYSFALLPEEHQPSGTCNMSRIDNATLQLTLSAAAVLNNQNCTIYMFCVNYNVLRIMSGMGKASAHNSWLLSRLQSKLPRWINSVRDCVSRLQAWCI